MTITDESGFPSSGAFYDERALRISNMIDEELRKESAKRRDARKREVKVMLLGQAESGKSTLQKQFQLYYASPTLDSERPSWRPVVYFNIIKAVRMILSELDYEFASAKTSASTSSSSSSSPVNPSALKSDTGITEVPIHSNTNGNGKGNGGGGGRGPDADTSPEVQREIAELRIQLLPLIAIEDSLASELSGGVSVSGGRSGAYVRSGWQALVTPSWPVPVSASDREREGNGTGGAGRGRKGASEVILLAAKALASALGGVEKLWAHRVVRRFVGLRKIRLDESAAFFLENLKRIAEPDYIPTNTDILNVRLQTLGIMEHTFPINMGGLTYDWKLYDVGGARGQRHAWVPYFDDATAIIFLAPISAFDQYLEEDPKTNRIDDSLQLFTAICSNKLLKDAHLVLMLNKADLLKKKLASGVRVRKYITSYGERPDTYESVSDYFRSHFLQVHRRKDISKRSLYVHFTSMLDIKATQSIISNVGEVIIRQHIAQIGLA